jgi:surfactin synthase thioesterase subunit
MRLLCLPYSGASGTIYSTWQRLLPDHLDVVAIEYPGRLTRSQEEPLSECAPLVRALADGLADQLDLPYALFGYSLGALLAFELAHAFRYAHAASPVHLFVAVCGGPRLGHDRSAELRMSDAEFIAHLERKYGALPEGVMVNPDMRQYVLKTMRADFGVINSYAYTSRPPLTCPITAIGGTQDQIDEPDLRDWGRETSNAFRLQMFDGGHFLINTCQGELMRYVVDALDASMSAESRRPMLRG